MQYVHRSQSTPLTFSALTVFFFLLHFSYKTRDEFIADVRLIFDNCEIFNEDDSPVGKAGHSLRKFFESRWIELTDKHS